MAWTIGLIRYIRDSLPGQLLGWSSTDGMVPENLTIRLTGSNLNYGASGARGFAAGQESWRPPWPVSSPPLITFTAGTAGAFGILLGAFFAISFAIRKEDVSGTLTGDAPAVPAAARGTSPSGTAFAGNRKSPGRVWRSHNPCSCRCCW